MDDRRLLLKAIQAEPLEDTPRLILADWYEEHGDVDRAEFIRLQIHEPKSHRIAFLFHRENNFRRWIPEPFAPHEVKFERGLIVRVKCDCPKFYDHAGELFREGAIEVVKMRDRKADRDFQSYIWVKAYNWPQIHNTWVESPYVLPPDIWERLSEKWVYWPSDRKGEYDSRKNANKDLMQAALAYGREQAALLDGSDAT